MRTPALPAALAFVLAVAVTSSPARAAAPGEEVDITAGAVTALSCALEARKTGRLELLSSCPLSEARGDLVVFDVQEKEIYRISKKKVFRYELEEAFGGGSIDLTGKVAKVDKKTRVAVVDVEEYSITKKPKAGSFKGCL